MNKLPKNFDWKYYISVNPDLVNYNTEELAINHYLTYGINENRHYYKSINILSDLTLSNIKTKKILILYVIHEINDNFLFFMKKGYIDDLNYDFYIIINNLDLKIDLPFKKNLHIINRENIGLDFGGWNYVLFMNDLYKNYDYFFFINSTMLGPFVPKWNEKNWIEIFINKISDSIKLIGCNCCPFIQSSFFVTDIIGLNLLISNNIFKKDLNPSKKEIIDYKLDITYVIKTKYDIYCFSKSTIIDPSEVIFVKSNAFKDPEVLDSYKKFNYIN